MCPDAAVLLREWRRLQAVADEADRVRFAPLYIEDRDEWYYERCRLYDAATDAGLVAIAARHALTKHLRACEVCLPHESPAEGG